MGMIGEKMSNGRTNIVLPLALVGAILLSAVGFIGLLATLVPENGKENGSIADEIFINKDFQEAEMKAEQQFDGSFDQGELARAHAPELKSMPSSKGFTQATADTTPQQSDQGATRSQDELLSQEGYVSIDNTPDAPAVEMDETFTLLNGKGSLLEDSQIYIPPSRTWRRILKFQ
jgi:hypothetical protein